MKSIITNAAEITVLRLIDNTYKTGGGPVSVGATVVVASKGPVGKVTQVRDDNWQDLFGKPLPKRSSFMEGLRHLSDAVQNCNYVNVVRVVHDDAKFPSLLVKLISYHGEWTSGHAYVAGDVVTKSNVKYICVLAHTASEENDPPNVTNWAVFTSSLEVGQTSGSNGHPYGTTLSLGNGYVLEIWPIDGDPSTNRSFEIANVITEKGAWVTATAYEVNDVITVTGGKLICTTAHTSSGDAPTLAVPTTSWKAYKGEYDQRFTLNIYDKDDNGDEYLLETYLAGIAPTDKDDMGRPAFIETVLEQNSDRFRCNIDETLTWSAIKDSLKYAGKTAFVGGTNGSDPETEDWIAAWDLFRNETFLCNLMFAAGVYDEDVLANCIDIAGERHCSFFFDVNPNLQSDQAIAWIKGTGLENRQAAVYYCPFSANDRWYGGKTVWGASGAAANACAKGDANMTGAIPGIHYAPAGINRGMLERTGVKALYPEDVINRDDFYDARINPIVASESSGGAMIDDCLTIHYKQNYSRFIWVNRIANYIDHRFVEGAAYMKFEPDGLTRQGLTRLTKEILDQLVTSGALVTPRDSADGNQPYKLVVKQEEIDLWLVTWDFCPTGAARRIAGQPRLIK
jgi:hypothetical protein